METMNPLTYIARHWWMWVLRGAAAVAFGILTFAWPAITVAVFVILFGVYALVDGVFALTAALTRHGERGHRWLLALAGLVSIAAGVVTFAYPAITALALLYLIAIWAILTGVLELGAASRWHDLLGHAWLIAVGGVASIIFGILAMVFPVAGALGIIWLIGTYAIIFGVLLMAFGLRVRRWEDRPR